MRTHTHTHTHTHAHMLACLPGVMQCAHMRPSVTEAVIEFLAFEHQINLTQTNLAESYSKQASEPAIKPEDTHP